MGFFSADDSGRFLHENRNTSMIRNRGGGGGSKSTKTKCCLHIQVLQQSEKIYVNFFFIQITK